MGQLVDGRWRERSEIPHSGSGSFERGRTRYHGWLGRDEAFPPEPGRYHLYLAHACPWCHRVAIVRQLLGLEEILPVSYVHPVMGEGGWRFETDGTHQDRLFDAQYLHELYVRADPEQTGRVTVPVLWDTTAGTIVNNESSELIRMLGAFDATTDADDLYPEPLRPEIDALNADVYDHVNNGVYKCGFAGSQEAYETAFRALFEVLERLETRLEGRTYLVGERLTEADVRLWVTLIRFDAVYHGHFKCNLRRIDDHPNLARYLRHLFAIPAFRNTTELSEIKTHYYASHRSLNPSGIVPLGPQLTLERLP